MAIRSRACWLLGALVIVFFHRPLTTGTFFFRDLYQLFYPKKMLLVAALRSGQLPLWDPFTHGGQPFLAMPSNVFFQPANVLYLFLPTIAAFNVAIVLHFFLAALGAYWLARTIGMTPAASFGCGAMFAFCGYALSAANLLLIFSLPAFPFAVAFLHRAIDGRRAAIAGAAVAFAWPLLSGGAEAFAMLVVTAIAWTFATGRGRSVKPLVLAIGFGLGLSLIQTMPAAEVIRNSSRVQRRSFESFTAWSVDPRRMPELFIPRFFGDTARLDDRAYWGANRESERFPYMLSIYFGALSLMLAGYGAFARRDHLPRATLFVLSLLGLVLSLGKWLPYFREMYELLPLIGTFRFPVKAIAISLLPIAILAGLGIDALRDRPNAFPFAAAGAIVLAMTLLFASSTTVAAWLSRTFFGQPLSDVIRDGLAHSFWHVTIVLIAAAVVTMMRRPDLLAALVAIDLLIAGWTVNVYAPRAIFDAPQIAARVRALVGDGRFYRAPDVADLALRAPSDDIMWLARWRIEALSGYTAATFGIPVIFSADYDGLAPRSVVQLANRVNSTPWPLRVPILRASGVRTFIAPDHIALPGITEVARLQTAEMHPLFVYTIPDARPAMFAGSCSGSIRLVHRTFNTSEWVSVSPCAGSVIIDDTWYPGWRVFVDGKERPLARANLAFSAVAVDAGQHTIVKRYAPRLPLVGAIASVAALALLTAVCRAGSSSPR